MNKFVNVENEYITSVQIGGAGIPITDEEYDAIFDAIRSGPESPDGFIYRLKTDLSWELHELPTPDSDPEISDSEALAIITGGEDA